MSQVLKAEIRDGLTRSVTRSLRRQGRVPGILYGKGISSLAIHLDASQMWQTIRDKGLNHVFQLQVDGNKFDVMVYELQQDPLKGHFLHVDFKKVSMNEKVETTVPIHLSGEAPGVKEGGVAQQQLRELEIRCLPGDIPESIHADISRLNIGDSLTVADLQLPEDIDMQHDKDEVIVSILAPRLDPVERTENVEEPEVIEKGK